MGGQSSAPGPTPSWSKKESRTGRACPRRTRHPSGTAALLVLHSQAPPSDAHRSRLSTGAGAKECGKLPSRGAPLCRAGCSVLHRPNPTGATTGGHPSLPAPHASPHRGARCDDGGSHRLTELVRLLAMLPGEATRGANGSWLGGATAVFAARLGEEGARRKRGQPAGWTGRPTTSRRPRHAVAAAVGRLDSPSPASPSAPPPLADTPRARVAGQAVAAHRRPAEKSPAVVNQFSHKPNSTGRFLRPSPFHPARGNAHGRARRHGDPRPAIPTTPTPLSDARPVPLAASCRPRPRSADHRRRRRR